MNAWSTVTGGDGGEPAGPRDGSGGWRTATGGRSRTISCLECDDEGVRDDHGEQAVIACPSCGDILYRPLAWSDP